MSQPFASPPLPSFGTGEAFRAAVSRTLSELETKPTSSRVASATELKAVADAIRAAAIALGAPA